MFSNLEQLILVENTSSIEKDKNLSIVYKEWFEKANVIQKRSIKFYKKFSDKSELHYRICLLYLAIKSNDQELIDDVYEFIFQIDHTQVPIIKEKLFVEYQKQCKKGKNKPDHFLIKRLYRYLKSINDYLYLQKNTN